MPKYNKTKYGTQKYGHYYIDINDNVDINQLTSFRLKTMDFKGNQSKPIVNQNINIKNSENLSSVRLKTNSGDWVYHQSISIAGNFAKLRIKSVNSYTESKWIESSIGIVGKAGR